MSITADLQSKFCYFDDLCLNRQIIWICENIIYDSLKCLRALLSNVNFKLYTPFVNIEHVLNVQD